MEGQPVAFTAAAHAEACAHHAAIVDSYRAEPIYVCTDPVGAGHQPLPQRLHRTQEEERDPEAEAVWEAERERQNQRQEALIVAGRVRRAFAEGLIHAGGIKAAEPLLRLAVHDVLLGSLEDNDPEEIRDLGQLLGVSVPEEIEDWEPVLEAFVQAVQAKRTVQDLIGILFALRLLDYEVRARSQHQWQSDEGLCRYVMLLTELGYEPSDIERELLAEWATSGGTEVEANP